MIATEESLLIIFQIKDTTWMPKAFYIDGPGGTGKTFLSISLLNFVRAQGRIALAVASSGIAAQLLPGGRTAHSRFKYPQNIDENSTGNIKHRRQTSLIVYDEAPMHQRHYFEALDRTFRDLTGNDILFGGKTIVFGGDFRQCAPVMPHAVEADIIASSLKRSYIWRDITRFSLTINMRLMHNIHNEAFQHRLLAIGNGVTNDAGCVTLDVSMCVSDLHTLIHNVYPNLQDNYIVPDFFSSRSILCPKNEQCALTNEILLDLTPGSAFESLSSDSLIDTTDSTLYPLEFLQSLQ